MSSGTLTYFQALLDPEVTTHRLPILRTGDIQQSVKQTSLHTLIKHVNKFMSNVRLIASQSGQERWF